MAQHASTTAVRSPLQAVSPLTARVSTAALGVAAVALAIVETSHQASPVAAARVVGVALPVGFGLLRLSRVRDDRFASLLLAAGATFALTTLAESSDSTVYSFGRVAVWLIELMLVVLILAFPYGRLRDVVSRRLVTATGVLVATLYLPTALLAPYPHPSPFTSCATSCPANAFMVSSHAAGAVNGYMRPLREVLTFVIFALVTVAVTRRALRSGLVMRLLLLPVAAVAVARLATLGVYFLDRRGGQTSDFADAVGWLYVLSLPILTLAFAGGLLARRLFVADALERLTAGISSRPTPREVRSALARALCDPALEVLFAVRAAPGGWIDANGWPAQAPRARDGRAVTPVSSHGSQLATIVHDEALAHDRALLRGLSSYVVTALENRHLVADLNASLDELRRSRTRLVTVADQERQKIERDLHDGAQQRLVALQIKLELLAEHLDLESPEDAESLRAFDGEIAATLDELRRLGHGLYPPVLADRGLKDALHAVARTAPMPTTIDAPLPHRYPREVESAVYFVCLEALQNATKHADGATGLSIAVSGNGRLRFDVRDDGAGFDARATPSGAGFTNMRDRIGALGGTIEVTSKPGRGTRVTGMIPVE